MENELNGFGKARPSGRFFFELLTAFGGEAVEFRVAAGVGCAPLGGKVASVFEPVQRGIKRPLLDLQHIARDLLDALGDGVAVNGPRRGDFEDEQIEGALRQVGLGLRHTLCFYIYHTRCVEA